ncbi:MAG: SURF1 family protein [Kangiellaceae bacterium]|nr:SURF1 family protein [Kangiellaceae bacterium]MCW9018435.1 SURF1 family protein [Kangiellaceae bacterium]
MKHTIEYSIGKYQIRLNIWLLILFLIMQTLLNELGFWQLNRAKEKQVTLYQLEQGSISSIDDLTLLTQQHLAQFQHVELELEVEHEKTIYLDNQTNNKAPGYHVLNLVKDVKTGKFLLINRGWIFAGKDRNYLPEVEKPLSTWDIKGRLYSIGEGVAATAQGEIEYLSDGIRLPVLDKRVLGQLKDNFRLPLEDFIVRIDKNEQHALEVNWMWTNMPVEKHLAYAVQWFGLALALLIICIIVAVKKKTEK